jgi:hypothetical protein
MVSSSPHASIGGSCTRVDFNKSSFTRTSEQTTSSKPQNAFKRECVWQPRFATLEDATTVIAAWSDRYNNERPNRTSATLTAAIGGIATKLD